MTGDFYRYAIEAVNWQIEVRTDKSITLEKEPKEEEKKEEEIPEE